MRVLAIIPARGGSKSIPRKNIRLIGGVPLIAHAIRACQGSARITRALVSTEDEEIAVVARRFGIEVLRRPPELSSDEATLAQVVHQVTTELESAGETYDVVATVHPTSPLVRSETLDRAIGEFADPTVDTVVSVYDSTHLYWKLGEGGWAKPLFANRVNRQFLPPLYSESGAIIASRRAAITPSERIGCNVRLIVLSRDEAVDIDTYHDWWLAEHLLNRRRIVFHVIGSRESGLGHAYRALTLARRLTDHEVLFIAGQSESLAVEIIRRHAYEVRTYEKDPLPLLDELQPDIVVNDVLDTDVSMVRAMKERGWRVVNFEDQGIGIDHADAVINALYEMTHPSPHIYNGSQYYCLREEFLSATPRPVEDRVTNILICFGGTDPSRLTLKAIKAAAGVPRDIHLCVILGPGFREREEVDRQLGLLPNPSSVVCDTRVISHHMENADLMITSGGRTVYEAAALAVPTIVLCQNHRELQHLFASTYHGFVNLGLGSEVAAEKLGEQMRQLAEDATLRREMQRRMLLWDGRSGVERVIPIILGVTQK
jgi:CMP-N-acetylneuraminic acid synthetase/spore coat polysaccharide biosynthesis predicted glycosyltransferase SpsG